MPKIKLTFTRTRKEVGSIEVEVTDEVATELSRPHNLDAWARFTMAHQVTDWKSTHLVTPGSQVDHIFTAELDGKPMDTLYRQVGSRMLKP